MKFIRTFATGAEFVSKNIFEKTLVGKEKMAIDTFSGENFSDKLSNFYNQAVRGEITPPIPKIRPVVQEEFVQVGKLSQLTPEPKISEPLKPEILTSETLTKPYTETTKKAIIDTAEAVDEHPSIVSRVADSLRKTKTSLVEYVQNAEIRVRQLTEKKGRNYHSSN